MTWFHYADPFWIDVVTADTATFELIRIASIHYFESTQGNKDVIHIRKYTPSSVFFVAFEARNILSFWAGWILKFSLAAVLPSVQ
jgi:hypothetical protein